MADGFATFEDIIKREKWGNKFVWVARDPQTKRLITWQNVKGSKVTKSQLIDRYKESNTFKKGVKVRKETLTNFKETIVLHDDPRQARRTVPDKKKRQYIVEGFIGKTRIVASSQISGSAFAQSNSEMAERARESFWELVSQKLTGGYDANEGKKFEDQVTGYREGWRYYETI